MRKGSGGSWCGGRDTCENCGGEKRRGGDRVAGGVGRTVWECDFELEEAALPYRFLFSWDADFPFLEVHDALGVADGFGEEAEGVVSSPLLSVARV